MRLCRTFYTQYAGKRLWEFLAFYSKHKSHHRLEFFFFWGGGRRSKCVVSRPSRYNVLLQSAPLSMGVHPMSWGKQFPHFPSSHAPSPPFSLPTLYTLPLLPPLPLPSLPLTTSLSYVTARESGNWIICTTKSTNNSFWGTLSTS